MVRKIAAAALVLFLAAALADFAGFKLGTWSPAPSRFAALASAIVVCALIELGCELRDLWRRGWAVRGLGKVLLLAGLVLAGAGGLANWLFGIQGFVLLTEGDPVPLAGGHHFDAFDPGPLADPAELQAVVRLVDLDLRRVKGGFYPEATLVVSRAGLPDEKIRLVHDRSAALGSLRLYLGAFGFAPRIVVLKGDETLLDATVPFSTLREGERGVSFEGELVSAKHGLQLRGAVSLESADPGVPGHPTVWLGLRRGDEELGAGELRLGHFGEVKDGYRLGAAGLKRWAEMDVSRRTSPAPVIAGTVLAALGAAAWALGAWRRR